MNYQTMTDDEARAEAERIAQKLGMDPAAVLAFIELKRRGHDGDVVDVELGHS